jgi:RNA polymerase sigma-70 factor (ECF subfamily)
VAVPRAARTAPLDFEALYRSCRDDVFAYAAGMLRDRAAAEDVTATAFERAYRKRRLFNPRRGNERAWIFGIARNASLDELRRRSRQGSQVQGDVPWDAGIEDEIETSVRRQAVRSALRGLDPRERELVLLKFHAGLGNAEIARVLAISETNVGSRLHRTITKLREACDEGH